MYATQMSISEAVERTITECIREGILEDFLKQNRAEAIKVSIYEYNEELHLATVRQEGYEDGLVEGIEKGIKQGKALDILELLEELGEVPEELKDRILRETQAEVLFKWHKWAAKADSMKAFEKHIEE